MAQKRAPALDAIDVKILAALQRDGRSTIAKLAERVGLSPRASLERVRRLEAAGVIAGYHAVVELRHLSRPVNVFAEIILDKQANRRRFERRLATLDAVVECWEVSGAVDYLAKPADADDVTDALLAPHDEKARPPENPMSADRVRWEHIQRIYELCQRNVSETARRLNMHRRTLQRILAKRAPK